MKRVHGATALAAAGLFAAAAGAADLAPKPAALARAVKAGIAEAAAHEGYPLRSHLLYEVRDARVADPADGAVDAIVLATPIERTRHAAYLAAYTRQKVTVAQAYADAGLPPGGLAVIVYAHGADADDEAFATGFSPATLTFAGAEPLTAKPTHSEITDAVYPLAVRNRSRQVATISYRFDVGGIADAGRRTARLSLRDATGKVFEIPVDLAQFE